MSLLTQACFYTSAARLDQLPAPGAPEVCFVGRSNAGKSSAINVLTNQRRLAYSSKTPGRTRLINMFRLPDPEQPQDPEAATGFLVDLPGYGYAAVAHEARVQWGDVLGAYVRDRASLAAVVLLLDIRRGITDMDRNLAAWLEPAGRPVLALLTKADKFPYGQRVKAEAAVRKELAAIGQLDAIAFSSTHRIGLEQTAAWIESRIVPPAAPADLPKDPV